MYWCSEQWANPSASVDVEQTASRRSLPDGQLREGCPFDICSFRKKHPQLIWRELRFDNFCEEGEKEWGVGKA